MRFFKGFVVFSLAMAVFSVTGCDLFTAGLGAKVDLAPPVAKIISPAPNTYVNADSFTVTGTASDDSGSPNLTVRVKNASGAVVQTLNVSPDSAGNWSITFKTRKAADQTNALTDGQYTIDVTAADAKGKTQNTYTSVIIDTLPPTVLVTSPLYKNGSQYTNYIDIKGEVYDANAIKDVQVSLLKADGAVLAGPTVADGTNTWTIRFELKDKIQELVDQHVYSYNVVVTDKAGNQNTYYFHREDIVTLKNNHNSEALFPATDEIGKIDQLGITGATSGITPEELKTKQLSNVNNFGSFKYLQDPQIEFQFTNIDPTKGYEENLLPPKSKISGIINPLVNAGAIDTSSIKVEIFDYSGLLKNTIVSGNSAVKILSVSNSVSFSFALVDASGNDLVPGRYSFKIYANAEGVSSVTNPLQIMIDAEAPYFEETNITADNVYQKAPFSLKFKGSHSTELQKIELYEAQGSNDYPAVPDKTISFSPGTYDFGLVSSITPAIEFINLPFMTNPPDGLYKYRAVLTTISGKVSILLITVYKDNMAPKIGITSPAINESASTTSYTIQGTANDAGGVGVATVEYSLDSTDGTDGTWTAFSGSEFDGFNWTKAITIPGA
ncbi:Ig-like domain-containing protein, partial [Gracilinema caldarium]|uniref:Ig-like domain-containing protein n=1 Tax=Gracilinema caldarium TaxID=215591 RepID=UPI0026F2BB52